MKTLFILISLLALTSCGVVQKQEKSLSIHPELTSYLSEFEYIYGSNIDDLNMTFANTISNSDPSLVTLGYCSKGTTHKNKIHKTIVIKTPKIVINLSRWESMSELDKKQLVFHELGHCILNRDHSESTASIMYWMFSNDSSEEKWGSWVSELFNRDNAKIAYYNYNNSPTASTMASSTPIQSAEILGDITVDSKDCVHDRGTEFEEHNHDEESEEANHE